MERRGFPRRGVKEKPRSRKRLRSKHDVQGLGAARLPAPGGEGETPEPEASPLQIGKENLACN